jgi:hypothetical protein
MRTATRGTTNIARQPKVFDVPERNARVPNRLYKEISPHNPHARFTFFTAVGLMYEGKLVRTILEKGLVKVRKNASWLKCLTILEVHGISDGVHYLDLADLLGITPPSAKTACLKAEKIVFDIYGFHVGFFTHDGIFKLAAR